MKCHNCQERRARWRPDYSPFLAVFCTKRCAAEYAHELVAEQAESDREDAERAMDDLVDAVRAANGCS